VAQPAEAQAIACPALALEEIGDGETVGGLGRRQAFLDLGSFQRRNEEELGLRPRSFALLPLSCPSHRRELPRRGFGHRTPTEAEANAAEVATNGGVVLQ